ncbi:Fe(2+) transporter permease subunit FeoB [Vibrio salinus]|uniref:Fe(2+) transporter permease subunit FeoB n=1 Tax=Vibrio salinus TaxID=2899784 RepID=UPI001E403B23|nr:Fe(2+) transporter permease subunit FeoB [Vibrio salinus]MCE0495006.1 Fe(2+) transporter permease subunit FeoB [Vibrio salinus]
MEVSKSSFCIVGNPNCGKTTLFNDLTGSRQTVGNWPGVTVDKKTGFVHLEGQSDQEIEIVDLPGVYSLSCDGPQSEDEQIARDYILSEQSQLVLNIIDASNLERNLYLTLQLIEMQVPLVVAVNMLDIAKKRHLDLDLDKLADQLGCPVVGIVAAKSKGIKALKASCQKQLNNPQLPSLDFQYGGQLDEAVHQLTQVIEGHQMSHARWRAIEALEFGSTQELTQDIEECRVKLLDVFSDQQKDEIDIEMADSRYQFIETLSGSVITRKGIVSQTITDHIDKIVLNRILGIPIFLVAMYLMFLFTINVGSAFIDFFDIFFGTVLVDGLGALMRSMHLPEWLTVIVSDGIGGGIQTVSTFIPVIGCLYLFLSFLEDSGYMARAAFVMDRMMRGIGLPGKAFVPLIVGFGCNVPAIMASRTLENRRDRILTVMMAPFMSCGARLPVYVLFATAFFPRNGQNLVFGLYIIGIIAALVTGLLLKRTALKGETSSFVMELPPYHIPTISAILIRTWERLKNFVLRAGKLIVIIVTILSFLNSIGTDGSFGHDDSPDSVLSKIGQTITPVFSPMGMDKDNWPAAVGMFTGIFAKEAVVGTLNSLYSSLADQQNSANSVADNDGGVDVIGGIEEAFASIPANLADLGSALSDPLGLDVGDVSDTSATAQDLEVEVTSIGMIQNLFHGTLGAFAYLIMVLLYIPCVAAVGAIWREVGAKWTVFASLWTTGLGYSAAVCIYQIGTFTQHPVSSAAYICVVLALMGALLLWITKSDHKHDGTFMGKGPVLD